MIHLFWSDRFDPPAARWRACPRPMAVSADDWFRWPSDSNRGCASHGLKRRWRCDVQIFASANSVFPDADPEKNYEILKDRKVSFSCGEVRSLTNSSSRSEQCVFTTRGYHCRALSSMRQAYRLLQNEGTTWNSCIITRTTSHLQHSEIK